jgi:hypothetical protein
MNLYYVIKLRHLLSINSAVSPEDKEISFTFGGKRVENDGNTSLATTGIWLIRNGKCLYT